MAFERYISLNLEMKKEGVRGLPRAEREAAASPAQRHGAISYAGIGRGAVAMLPDGHARGETRT